LINPVDEQVYPTAPSGMAEDVGRAVAAAYAQLYGGPLSKLNGTHRAALLNNLVNLVERDLAILADMDARAIGRSRMEPRMMDVPDAVAHLHAAAGWANQLEGRTIPSWGYTGMLTLSYTVREPVGVVVAIVPWNSPPMISKWKLEVSTVSALSWKSPVPSVRPGMLRNTSVGSSASWANDMPMPLARMPCISLAVTFWPRGEPLASTTAMVTNRSALSCLLVLFRWCE